MYFHFSNGTKSVNVSRLGLMSDELPSSGKLIERTSYIITEQLRTLALLGITHRRSCKPLIHDSISALS
jgi:hypothetical protein